MLAVSLWLNAQLFKRQFNQDPIWSSRNGRCCTIEKNGSGHIKPCTRGQSTRRKKCTRTARLVREAWWGKKDARLPSAAIFARRAYGIERFGAFVGNRTHFCFNSEPHPRTRTCFTVYIASTWDFEVRYLHAGTWAGTRLAAMRAYSAYAGEITQSRTEVCTVAGKHCNPVTLRLRGLSALRPDRCDSRGRGTKREVKGRNGFICVNVSALRRSAHGDAGRGAKIDRRITWYSFCRMSGNLWASAENSYGNSTETRKFRKFSLRTSVRIFQTVCCREQMRAKSVLSRLTINCYWYSCLMRSKEMRY